MNVETIVRELSSQQTELETHRVFSQLNTQQDLITFMQWHVFAVWDFMSLVKRLQHELTSIALPWTPSPHPFAARLINDIVLGEESDETPDGNHLSHFELYIQAMQEVGADTKQIESFVRLIEQGLSTEDALRSVEAPPAVQKFVIRTINMAQHGTLCEVLGYFFFGREDIIPRMFQAILTAWTVDPNDVPIFMYYLQRHIELDADTHGPAALKIIKGFVSDEAHAKQLRNAANDAVQARMELWNSLSDTIVDNVCESLYK